MELKQIKRRRVMLAAENVVRAEPMYPGRELPLVMQPGAAGVNPAVWVAKNLDIIERSLFRHGGILFQDFGIKSAAEFESFVTAFGFPLLSYDYRSSPRSHVKGRIYTSTEYPPEQAILLHNEMAYAHTWPMKIWFFCLQPPTDGGETPIADSRRIYNLLPPKIRDPFIQKKILYVRNYDEGLDLSWREVFQTDSKAQVESFCRQAAIEFEWNGGDRLQTRQICPAVMTHPRTGETVWFNQAHLFHVSSLPQDVQETMLRALRQEELPRNAYYGDGLPIESSILDEIRELYQQEAVTFPWRAGDILMLDNMLTAHGRAPFTGSRKVLVGMAEGYNA